ncbi:MAG: hypothetical protein ACLFNK_00415 [Candidatus Woesearchaeota archaeon]
MDRKISPISIIILSILIASLTYMVHTESGLEREEYLSSDETGAFLTSLNLNLDPMTLRAEGEEYHPFFGFIVQNILVRTIGTDYSALHLAVYGLFAFLCFLILTLSKLTTGRHIFGIFIIMMLAFEKQFILTFLLGFRLFYQTNIILTAITTIFMLRFIRSRKIDDANGFMFSSLLNISTMETGQLHLALTTITICLVLGWGKSMKHLKKRLSDYLKEKKNEDKVSFVASIMLFCLILVTETILLASRTTMGGNLFGDSDPVDFTKILILGMVLVFAMIFDRPKDQKAKNRYMISFITISQLAIFWCVSLIFDFPGRVILYLLPLYYISLVSLIIGILKKIMKRMDKRAFIIIAIVVMSLITIDQIDTQDISNAREKINKEREVMEDLQDIITENKEKDEYLVYSLGFSQIASKGEFNLTTTKRTLKDDNIIFRDSFINASVELYDHEEFRIIVQHHLLERFRELIDEEIECEKIRETSFHTMIDCKELQHDESQG